MENPKKQLAVEWFLENLKNLIKESELTDMKPSEFDARERELLEQAKAKEMESENIISGLITLKESYEAGQKSMYCGGHYNLDADSFEDFVNGKLKQHPQ